MASFYKCGICGNIAGLIEDGGGALACCNADMPELTANTVDASKEKHVPVVKVSGNTVTVAVGSIPHPMDEAHLISFIYLETKNGG